MDWENEMKRLLLVSREHAEERKKTLRENALAIKAGSPRMWMTEEADGVTLFLPLPLMAYNEAFRTHMAAMYEAADAVGYASENGMLALSFTVA